MTTLAQVSRRTYLWGGMKIWQRNRDAFIRSWKVEVGGIAIEPFIMLVALGFGLGAYVSGIGDLSYAEFVAPGVVAAYAMFHSTFDSTYGAYLRMETHHIYEAYLFTPIEPEDIVMGEVMWGASRGLLSSIAVLIASAIFGLLGSPYVILAIPVAYLIGMLFASIAMIMTATATTIGAMNNFFTLFILPMFWLSGVFFPLERLPDSIQPFAWILPLTPSVALVRGLVLGELSMWMLVWLGQIIVYIIVARWIAGIFMRRRLIK